MVSFDVHVYTGDAWRGSVRREVGSSSEYATLSSKGRSLALTTTSQQDTQKSQKGIGASETQRNVSMSMSLLIDSMGLIRRMHSVGVPRVGDELLAKGTVSCKCQVQYPSCQIPTPKNHEGYMITLKQGFQDKDECGLRMGKGHPCRNHKLSIEYFLVHQVACTSLCCCTS
jgi:hypothetical protein